MTIPRRYILGAVPLFFWLCCDPLFAQELTPEKAKLATQARDLLTRHCYRCHKGKGSESGADFDVLRLKTLTDPRPGEEKPYIAPGNVAKSYLVEYLDDGSMPKKRSPERETWKPESVEVLKKWIAAGAPEAPTEAGRDPVKLADMLRAMREDLNKADRDVRPYLRYFTLGHLHNNPAFSAKQLQLTRAAVSKVLNSLSWQTRIHTPRILDKHGTVLAVDIRDFGWTDTQWKAIEWAYPYGLSYENFEDRQLQKDDEDILDFVGKSHAKLVHIRADWFVATASRPPLYHRLVYELYLPALRKRADDPSDTANPKKMTARDLEQFLEVQVIRNMLDERPLAQRAGFARSGVSGQNRLIERHPLSNGRAYWKSYDFKSSTWEANLQQFPLRPRFDANPYEDFAFRHDGGEIIFHLPNGLQAYLLVDGKDNRIDAGPIEVVSDRDKTSGTSAIVNGLSCMACHQHGMLDKFSDEVRLGAGVFGKLKERVNLLYPEDKEMKKLVARDRKIFLEALDQSTGEFMRANASDKTPIQDFREEPVREVALKYLLDDLDVVAVACELYVSDAKDLQQRVGKSDELRKLGLGALAKEGGLIKRGAWEAFRGSSQMQQAARRLYGYSFVR